MVAAHVAWRAAAYGFAPLPVPASGRLVLLCVCCAVPAGTTPATLFQLHSQRPQGAPLLLAGRRLQLHGWRRACSAAGGGASLTGRPAPLAWPIPLTARCCDSPSGHGAFDSLKAIAGHQQPALVLLGAPPPMWGGGARQADHRWAQPGHAMGSNHDRSGVPDVQAGRPDHARSSRALAHRTAPRCARRGGASQCPLVGLPRIALSSNCAPPSRQQLGRTWAGLYARGAGRRASASARQAPPV